MKTKLTTRTIILLCVSSLIFSCCTNGPENVFCKPGGSNCLVNFEDEIVQPTCEPSSLRCQANPPLVERCNSAGTDWEEFLFCPEGTLCEEGVCLAETCSMGQTECGPRTLYECNDSGQWESYPCPEEQPCILGVCVECLKNEACSNGEMCIEGACQYIAPEITTSELPGGVVGTPYKSVLEHSGGKLPLTWSLSEGSLPDGIELTEDGTLTGTPSRAEAAEFAVALEDDQGERVTRNFTLHIYAEGPVLITTNSMKLAKEGSLYSFQFAAAGGASPYGWHILEGSLPAGLTLSFTGEITGKPEEIGSFPLAVRVVDASSPPTYDSKDFALEVRISPLEIVGGQQLDLVFLKVIILQPLIPFIPYSINLGARGGVKPYTWTEETAPPGLGWIISEWGLPKGLRMNSSGRISGQVMDTSDANTVSIPGALNISGYFFMGQVADSRSPSGSKKAIFCIPTISL